MLKQALYLIPYALVAALSPLAFAATLAVIGSGRVKALGFGTGFVLGQVAACSVLVLIGGAMVPDRQGSHDTFQSLLELGFGVLLLWAAVVARRRPPTASQGSGDRTKAALERLGRLHTLTAFLAGLLLGIGGPKRLVLTALASASITGSGEDGSREAALIVWYSLLATVLVWVPVVAFVILGKWALEKLDAAQRWLVHHQREATSYSFGFLGALLVVAGVLSLVMYG